MRNNNFPEPDIPADEAWKDMQMRLQNVSGIKQPDKTGKPFPHHIFLYAGIGLILMSIPAYFLLREKQQKQPTAITYSSQSKPVKDTLQDGTMVFLNKFSSINEVTISGKEEDMLIIKGDVYFDESKMSKSSSHQLKIGSINVLPQKAIVFVSFDTASNISLINVQSGNAVIEIDGMKLSLAAGESVKYDEKTKQLDTKKHVDKNLFSYATKIFEFSDTPLKEAAETIEKAYGVTIEFENAKLYNCRITTRFDNKSLKEILDIMAYTLNFEYQLDEKNNRVKLTGNGCN